jgi:peptide/nickel transport system substrate-binding protein
MSHTTRTRIAALATGALLAGGSLTACASSASTPSSGKPVKGGTITYAAEQEPPCLVGGWIQEAFIARQLLDSLVTLDEDGNVKPWLAESWKISPDGRTYTFALKPGVKFTDGTPVDAEAVAYNFDYFEKGGDSTAQVSMDPYFESAKALDDTHVQVELSKPFWPFLTLLSQAYFGIRSAHALKTRSDEQNCQDPIGSGPFVVDKWNHGQNLLLKRNDDYTSWPATAKHEGPAIVDGIDWKFVADGNTRYSALTTGQADAMYDVPTVHWKDAKSQFQTTLYVTPGHPVAFYMNTVKGVFTDKLVRQAFAYGADRKAAVEAAFHGVIPYEGNPAISQATPAYDSDVAADYAYDPDKADELLDQAGWTEKGSDGVRTKDGKPLSVKLVYPAGSVINQEGATILQALQQQWKQVGFDIKLVPATQAETFSGKYSGPDAYDAQPWYWTSPAPSIMWINWRPTTEQDPNYNNESFFNDEQLSALIQRGNSATDLQASQQYYSRAQQVVQDNAAAVGLYDMNTTIAVQNGLQDVWLEKSQGEPVFSDAYFTK